MSGPRGNNTEVRLVLFPATHRNHLTEDQQCSINVQQLVTDDQVPGSINVCVCVCVITSMNHNLLHLNYIGNPENITYTRTDQNEDLFLEEDDAPEVPLTAKSGHFSLVQQLLYSHVKKKTQVM